MLNRVMNLFELPGGSDDVKDPIEHLRARGIVLLGMAGWGTMLALVAASLFLRPTSSLMLLVIGVLINIAPTWVLLKRRFDAQGRIIVASNAAIYPAILVYLLQGSTWQMDAHLFFLVGLAALIMLCDWVPIAVASGIIACHHLILEYAAPNWVFSSEGNLARVLFHALAVILEFAVLAQVTRLLQRLLRGQVEALTEQRKLFAAAEIERARASEALVQAEAANDAATSERSRRKALEDRTATERQAELMILASEFERTVAEVVKTIHTSSQGLEDLAIKLDDVAGDADREASAAAFGAANTTSDIRQVAAAIGDLSASIRTIAVAAGHQNDLTSTAAGEGARSVETIAQLDAQVVEIDAFIEDIRGIAAKTNLLALNATIEAARAGDAGRGFAVVAGEVKSLASDAARASERIRDLLTDIRAGVSATAQKINGATDAVRDVAVAASQIASAVTEQNGYAGEIDRSAARAASGADMIERQMEGVALAISSAVSLSAQVRGDAVTLATGARDLRSSTQRFVAFLRDAELAAAE